MTLDDATDSALSKPASQPLTSLARTCIVGNSFRAIFAGTRKRNDAQAGERPMEEKVHRPGPSGARETRPVGSLRRFLPDTKPYRWHFVAAALISLGIVLA